MQTILLKGITCKNYIFFTNALYNTTIIYKHFLHVN